MLRVVSKIDFTVQSALSLEWALSQCLNGKQEEGSTMT